MIARQKLQVLLLLFLILVAVSSAVLVGVAFPIMIFFIHDRPPCAGVPFSVSISRTQTIINAFTNMALFSSFFWFCFLQFASYHQGSTTWLMWTTVITFITFTLVFDCAFTNESSFVFDPDADNWRRKTVRHWQWGRKRGFWFMITVRSSDRPFDSSSQHSPFIKFAPIQESIGA